MKKEKCNEKDSIFFKILLITVFFNIWFPKAGIKVSGIPLTVGNILFAVLFILWIWKKMKTPMKINKASFIILFGILYFFVRLFISYINGYSIENIIGFFIPLVIYPLIYFIIVDSVDNANKVEKILKIIINGFFFLCIYGIFQYIFGIDKVAIPGLTVNLTDYNELGKYWFLEKSNGVDVASAKIVGTYQNGNLFGISLLLIFPLVYNYFIQKNKNIKSIISLILFIVTVFLTLSRACWLGIFLFIFIEILVKKAKTGKSILLKIFLIFGCIFGIIFIFKYMPSIANRFFDTEPSDWISMSGRTDGIKDIFYSVGISNKFLPYLFGPQGLIPYYGLAYEMLFLSLFAQSGFFGIIMLYSVFLGAIHDFNCKSYISKAIRTALIIWLIVGLIECGYWLPPAALNIFLLIGLGYAEKHMERKE